MGLFGANNAAATQNQQNLLAQYQGDLSGINAMNAARNTQYGQDANAFGLNQAATAQANAARNTQYQNDLAGYNANQSAQTASNTAASQQYAQQLQAYQAQNAAQQQQYAQQLGAYGANLQGLTTNAGLQQAQNAAQQQAYSQGLNNYSTQYQAALTARNQPLNEMNALLTGQQVQNPTFNSYALQGQTQGADLLGATTAQGQYNQSLYNAQSANASSTNSAIVGLASTAAMAIAMY